jgi:hypothetical protein
MGGIFGQQIDCLGSISIIEKMKASGFALIMYREHLTFVTPKSGFYVKLF